MICRDTREAIAAYLDGRLAPSDREAVDRHLDDCEPCRGRLEGLAEAERLLSPDGPFPGPERSTDDLLAAMAGEIGRPTLLRRAGPDLDRSATRERGSSRPPVPPPAWISLGLVAGFVLSWSLGGAVRPDRPGRSRAVSTVTNERTGASADRERMEAYLNDLEAEMTNLKTDINRFADRARRIGAQRSRALYTRGSRR